MEVAFTLMTMLIKFLRKFPFLNKMTEETLGQLIRYLITGVLSFSIEYTLFIILRNILSISELAVNVTVYTIIFWINFLLNKFFSFQSHSNFRRQIALYGLLFTFNLLAGNVLLFSGIRYLLVLSFGEGTWPVLYLPKILIMFFIISWNFILYKKVIYK